MWERDGNTWTAIISKQLLQIREEGGVYVVYLSSGCGYGARQTCNTLSDAQNAAFEIAKAGTI